MNIRFVTELPAILSPSTVYFVKDVTGLVTQHISNNLGNETIQVTSSQSTAPGAVRFYNTFDELTSDTTVDTPTLAYVANAIGDPSVSAGFATYFFNVIAAQWTKVSDASLNSFKIVNDILYYNDVPVGFYAGATPVIGYPSIDKLSVDLITTSYIRTLLRIASINGYSETGLQIVFYYKDVTSSTEWVEGYRVAYTPGIMEYSHIFNNLIAQNTYVFKAVIMDTANPMLAITSNVTGGQVLLSASGYSDALFEIVGSTYNQTNVTGAPAITKSMLSSSSALEDDSFVGTKCFHADLLNYSSFDRTQTVVGLLPRKYEVLPKSLSDDIYIDGGELIDNQSIISVNAANEITQHTVSVVSEEERYFGFSYKCDPTRTHLVMPLAWNTIAYSGTIYNMHNGTCVVHNNTLKYILGENSYDYYSSWSSTYLRNASVFPYNNIVISYESSVRTKRAKWARSIVIGNKGYVIGGFNYTDNTYRRDLFYYDMLNPTGNTVSTGITLPDMLKGHSVFVLGRYVYVVGGLNTAIYRSLISPTGTLGNFDIYTSTFLPILDTQVVITKTKVYLIGGCSDAFVASNTIYSFDILDNDELGTLNTEAALPLPLYGHRCISFANIAYMVGGITADGVYIDTVYSAPISPAGILGSWSPAGNLPSVAAYGDLVYTDSAILYVSGHNGTTNINAYYHAPIQGWSYPKDTSFKRQRLTLTPAPLTLNDTKFYNSGQTVKTYTGLSTYAEAFNSLTRPFNTCVTEDIVQWLKLSNSNVTSSKVSRVFKVGDVIFAILDLGYYLLPRIYTATVTDTSISPMVLNRTLPNYILDVFKVKDYLYFIQFNSPITLKAKIGSDYILGDLEEGSFLPNVIVDPGHVIFSHGGYLYLGNTRAFIGHTGILENFYPTTGITTTGSYFVTDKNVFTITYYGETIQFALMNDGTIGSPVNITASVGSLPGDVSAASFIVTRDRVFVLGLSSLNTYAAVINLDGSIGPWTRKSDLPIALKNNLTIITENTVYLVGGQYSNGPVNPEIHSAAFDGWLSEVENTYLPDHPPAEPVVLSKTFDYPTDTLTITTEIHTEYGVRTYSLVETNKKDVVNRFKGYIWYSV